MNDFENLLRTALLGETPRVLAPGRDDLERSVAHFESCMRAQRWLTLVMLSGSGLPLVLGLACLAFTGRDATPLQAAGGVGLVLLGLFAAGGSKLWFLLLQNHFSLMRELKLTQLALLEREPGRL